MGDKLHKTQRTTTLNIFRKKDRQKLVQKKSSLAKTFLAKREQGNCPKRFNVVLLSEQFIVATSKHFSVGQTFLLLFEHFFSVVRIF